MKQQRPLFVSCKFLYNLFGLEVPNVDMVVLAPRHNPLPACNIKIQRINEQLNNGCGFEFISPNPGFMMTTDPYPELEVRRQTMENLDNDP